MSLDTSESFRSVMDAILLKPIGRAMANPLALALMITAVIMLIVRFTYDDDHIFRTMLRIFGVCTMFLFINNHVLISDMNSRQLNPDQQNVIRVLERGRARPSQYTSQVTQAAQVAQVEGGEGGNDDDDVDDDMPMIVSRQSDGSDILEQLPDASRLVVRA
jgi:hypothetical protein